MCVERRLTHRRRRVVDLCLGDRCDGSKRDGAGKKNSACSQCGSLVAALQFAAFCFVLAMIVSWAIDVGGSFPRSARNAVHATFFDVARIRAEPFEKPPPRFELIKIPAAPPVPNITVCPGATLSEVATASLAG